MSGKVVTTAVIDKDCKHLAAWVCDECDKIHIASLGDDDKIVGQINVDPDSLNALIVELMKLRDTGSENVRGKA